MDKKTKLDLKDILRGAGSTAQGKLDVHGVRDDMDDVPVYDRSKRKPKRDQYDNWLADLKRRGIDDDK